MSPEPGVRLGLDWGKARIGVAACDRDQIMAFPVTTVPTASRPIPAIVALIAEHQPVELVLGWPRALDGTDGPAVTAMKQVLAQLLAATTVDLVLIDERMSTVEASRRLASSGVNSRERRGIIDQAAAVGILDRALQAHRRR